MGTNDTVPENHGFLDGCYLHGDAYNGAATLVSFHFVRFILFTVMFTIAGPCFYRLVAAFFDLERDFKSVVDHYNDVTNGLIYTYIVFTLGNYAHTFDWVMAAFYFAGILAYSALVEVPFLRVSLPSWRRWSKGAWAVNLIGLALVLAAAGFHIRWAYGAGFLAWYLPLFLLATATVLSTIPAKSLHHYCVDNRPNGLGIERRARKAALVLFTRSDAGQNTEQRVLAMQLRARSQEYAASRRAKPAGSSSSPESSSDLLAHKPAADQYNADDGEAISMHVINKRHSSSHGHCEDDIQSSDGELNNTNAIPLNMPPEPCKQKHEIIEERLKRLHYLNVPPSGTLPLFRYRLHLHHWQIFYILAFFTRFDKLASRACAGIVLGIVTQGSAAYGYDAMMECRQ
ncbi:hypothetical protein IW140_003530 [Coemansia sp. RSA 1813]|nr:hypothetical protein EV178_003381 [Coemansia sp. RSA 1646]KAJ1772945.1 hypothetical protein LPJ74_001086 [Coemansia sp. RSA 1843]KAJ2093521.1 hypothetical protein IW138_000374 [Coemansia sp. RSA 986]KAJ2214338.1 hypothetical protein EV179_003120 [Coemansia sp. RSA 487]KAJ2568904.1 hypothetical protein IW140_003530 [Coemansia sp. RSA 1813]